MTHIEALREAIERLHGGTATHHESVPVKEVFRGQTVWDGIVEVFKLDGHPKTDRVYAWFHDPGDGSEPQHVTVLHVDPALTPLKAVQAFIVGGYSNAETA